MVYDLIKYHDSAVNYCKRPATLAPIDKNNYTNYVGVDLTLVAAIKND